MKPNQMLLGSLIAAAMLGSTAVQAAAAEPVLFPARTAAAAPGIKLNGPLLQGIALNGPILQGVRLNGPILQGVKLNGPGLVLQGTQFNGPGIVFQGEHLFGRGAGVFRVLRDPAVAVPGHSALSGLATADVKVRLPKR